MVHFTATQDKDVGLVKDTQHDTTHHDILYYGHHISAFLHNSNGPASPHPNEKESKRTLEKDTEPREKNHLSAIADPILVEHGKETGGNRF